MSVWLKWFLYRWLSPRSCVLFLLFVALSQIDIIKLNALNDIRTEQLASLVCV